MSTVFSRLNVNWNAEPNAPQPQVSRQGAALLLSFFANAFRYPGFVEEDRIVLRFGDCWRYRLGPTNDEGWFNGQCRFSDCAPEWGAFYELTGDLRLARLPDGWIAEAQPIEGSRHFLLYFRDETFECDAANWSMSVTRACQV